MQFDRMSWQSIPSGITQKQVLSQLLQEKPRNIQMEKDITLCLFGATQQQSNRYKNENLIGPESNNTHS